MLGGGRIWVVVLGAVIVFLGAGVAAYFLVSGSEDEAKAQTIRFQEPNEVGADPFTKPADVKGKDTVKVTRTGGGDSGDAGQGGETGQGPFGGTGSNQVCDRELLIRSLVQMPDRMKEWARVLGVDPTAKAVTAYIRKLKPVTLTSDTRVTNHTFAGGEAAPSQDILQAGTAVLADEQGNPVVRCRCGNPLAKPAPTPATAECVGCPPNYDTSAVCRAGTRCSREYPNPPAVKVATQSAQCTQPFTSTRRTVSSPFRVELDKAAITCEEAGDLIKEFLRKRQSGEIDVTSQTGSPVRGWNCTQGASGKVSNCSKDGGSVTAVLSASGQGQQAPEPAPEDQQTEGPTAAATVRKCPDFRISGGTVYRYAVKGISCSDGQPIIRGWVRTGRFCSGGWRFSPTSISRGSVACSKGKRALSFSVAHDGD